MNGLHRLAGEIGVSQRTLRRAVTLGMLTGEQQSGSVRIPLNERLYASRTWDLLSALRRSLRTEHNVRRAVLFGSVARGDHDQDSDIDLLVELRDASLDRVLDLEAKLEAATGRTVEINRFEDAAGDESFLAEVLEVGRVLVDRE